MSNQTVTTHGTAKDCPNVQSGEWVRCLGHAEAITPTDTGDVPVRFLQGAERVKTLAMIAVGFAANQDNSVTAHGVINAWANDILEDLEAHEAARIGLENPSTLAPREDLLAPSLNSDAWAPRPWMVDDLHGLKSAGSPSDPHEVDGDRAVELLNGYRDDVNALKERVFRLSVMLERAENATR